LNAAPPGEAHIFAERLRDRLGLEVQRRRPDLELFLSPIGTTIEESRPNLRLDLPEGGPSALLGFLASEALIRVERVGDDPAHPAKILSAKRLSERCLLRVERGIYRIGIDAPWGAGVTAVEVEANKVATCSLPEVIGRAPLRNAVARGEITIVDQEVKVIQLPSIPEPTIVEATFVPTFDGAQ
jgi:hypothetical protein